MKKYLTLGLLLSLALPFQATYALRCGSRLVLVGDHSTEVLRLCGEPESVKEWVVTRTHRSNRSRPYGPSSVESTVLIEEWLYNFGRQRFMQLLRFENGRLKKISSLSYGH